VKKLGKGRREKKRVRDTGTKIHLDLALATEAAKKAECLRIERRGGKKGEQGKKLGNTGG